MAGLEVPLEGTPEEIELHKFVGANMEALLRDSLAEYADRPGMATLLHNTGTMLAMAGLRGDKTRVRRLKQGVGVLMDSAKVDLAREQEELVEETLARIIGIAGRVLLGVVMPT